MNKSVTVLLEEWYRRYSYEHTAMSQADFARCVKELLDTIEEAPQPEKEGES